MSGTNAENLIDNAWLNSTSFRGWIPTKDKPHVDKYAVVGVEGADGEPPSFYCVRKTELEVSRGLKTRISSSKAYKLCTNPSPCKCNKVHLSKSSRIATTHTPPTPSTEWVSSPSRFPESPCYSLVMTGDDYTSPHLIPLRVGAVSELFCHEKGGAMFKIPVRDTERTAGLEFACTLMERGIISSCALNLCRYGGRNPGGCANGAFCLYIHTNKPKEESNLTPWLTAITPVRDAIQKSLHSEKLLAFIDHDLRDLGIRTVGDVQNMSNQLFETFAARDHANARRAASLDELESSVCGEFWTLLYQMRQIDLRTPLPLALQMFPGVSNEMLATLPPSMDVGALACLRPKQFYALRMPAPTFEACEKLRARFVSDQDPFGKLSIAKANQFFKTLASQVLGFRAKNAHESWRKKDATRPIVTSAITYVDPNLCKCHANGMGAAANMSMTANGSMAPGGSHGNGNGTGGGTSGSGMHGPGGSSSSVVLQSPKVTAQLATSTSFTVPPLSLSAIGQTRQSPMVGATVSPRSSSATAARPHDDRVPSVTHWCQCPRRWEMGLNYELSTPSGSRCSEQNVLGKIASMGLPTWCIREVFCHGTAHNGEDPNPLFPCGVCENMLRRISKDVRKQHGAEVMLYMFDAESNVRKLVCIPVSEISHRDGTSFRRFVEEDVHDEF